MKRSKTLHLTGIMAGASLTVTACDQGWQNSNSAPKDPVPAVAYRTLDECIKAGEVPADQCRASYQAAVKDDASHSPRYNERSTCEDVYGAGNCVPRTSQGGGSFFTPLLAGFVIGQMMNGGGYRGTGLYRQDDRYGGGWTTGFGGSLSRDYTTGRTIIDRRAVDPPDAIRQAPPRVQTRTSVISRGGFGGGGRSYGGGFGGGGHYGG
jgi:uncharacterized protein YgiB involved in biofilm formation